MRIRSVQKRKHLPGHGISLVVPIHFNADDQRAVNWRWLFDYWRAQLPEADIVPGYDRQAINHNLPFSKSCAVNDGVRKATGDILVIIDADGFVPASTILECAQRIRQARNEGHRLWFVPYRQFYRLTEAASARLLASDPKHPLEFPTPPWPEDILDTSGSQLGHWYGAGIQILPREAFDIVGGWDERFCVDEATQIFTQRGWKSHWQLAPGDAVLTLNHQTGQSEWQSVQAVNVFQGRFKMLSIESKTHSSMTTFNHKWPSIRRPDYRAKTGWGSKKETREWVTSETFTSESLVPMAALLAAFPITAKYSDAIVECVAWFWTEGSISRLRDGRRGRNVTISQSFVVNASKCSRIRTALTAAFGSASSFPRRGAAMTDDIPRWQERPDRRDIVFSLNAEAGALMQCLAPLRVPSYGFLLALTASQLDLFIEASLLGDGHVRRTNGEISLGQKNPAAADAFQFACVLAGHCTSVHTTRNMKGYDYGMTNVRLRSQKHFKLCKGTHSIVELEGTIWCPTTENHTWLARRNGKTYFTGNCGWGGEDHAAMRATDTLYWWHKTMPGQFLHVWHPMLSPEGTKNFVDWRRRMWENQSATGANEALSGRYYGANGDPKRMRRLCDEWKTSKD